MFSFGELMSVVRDASLCYYECYKIPDPGQHRLTRTEDNEVQLLRGKQREG